MQAYIESITKRGPADDPVGGPAHDTPEPGTLLLGCAGALLCGWTSRRKDG